MGLIKSDEKQPCIFGVAWRNQFIHNSANISAANIVLMHRATAIKSFVENIIRPGQNIINYFEN